MPTEKPHGISRIITWSAAFSLPRELLAWMGWEQDVHTATAQAAPVPCLIFTFSVLCSSSSPPFLLRGKLLEPVYSPLQPLGLCLGLIVEINKFIGKLPSKLLTNAICHEQYRVQFNLPNGIKFRPKYCQYPFQTVLPQCTFPASLS